jgi:hypothetical protein
MFGLQKESSTLHRRKRNYRNERHKVISLKNLRKYTKKRNKTIKSSNLAKHYSNFSPDTLKEIYDKARLTVITEAE